jgi:hypothetical protein
MVELGKAEGVILEREQIRRALQPRRPVRATSSRSRRRQGAQIVLADAPGPPSPAVRDGDPEIAEGRAGQARPRAGRARQGGGGVHEARRRSDQPAWASARDQAISRELRGEKIDIVEWAPDPATFVAARCRRPRSVSDRADGEGDEGSARCSSRRPTTSSRWRSGSAVRTPASPPSSPGSASTSRRGRGRGGAPPRRGGARAGSRGAPGSRRRPQLVDRLTEASPSTAGADHPGRSRRARGGPGRRSGEAAGHPPSLTRGGAPRGAAGRGAEASSRVRLALPAISSRRRHGRPGAIEAGRPVEGDAAPSGSG